MSDSDNLSEKDKIQILLEEYKALRAEISTRTGYGYQMIAIWAAVTTWLFGQAATPSWRLLIGFLIIAAPAYVLWKINVRDIWNAAHRVRELEREINNRAKAHLLVWEQLFAPGRKSYINSVFEKIEPLPRSHLPNLDDWPQDSN